MLYNLWTESREKIGEVILDEPPEVGQNVRCAGATFRVTGTAWVGAPVSNSVPSGNLLVELVNG